VGRDRILIRKEGGRWNDVKCQAMKRVGGGWGVSPGCMRRKLGSTYAGRGRKFERWDYKNPEGGVKDGTGRGSDVKGGQGSQADEKRKGKGNQGPILIWRDVGKVNRTGRKIRENFLKG